jgi:hypothetical protein
MVAIDVLHGQTSGTSRPAAFLVAAVVVHGIFSTDRRRRAVGARGDEAAVGLVHVTIISRDVLAGGLMYGRSGRVEALIDRMRAVLDVRAMAAARRTGA